MVSAWVVGMRRGGEAVKRWQLKLFATPPIPRDNSVVVSDSIHEIRKSFWFGCFNGRMSSRCVGRRSMYASAVSVTNRRTASEKFRLEGRIHGAGCRMAVRNSLPAWPWHFAGPSITISAHALPPLRPIVATEVAKPDSARQHQSRLFMRTRKAMRFTAPVGCVWR
jgi:hypothetical protein